IASNCSGSSNFSGNWTNIGPDSFSTQNLGMFRDVYASPRDTNFLLAACYGGLFRSRDAGRNWTCITDNTPVAKGIVSPVHIAVSPLDSQVIYLGSGTYYFQVSFIERLRYLGSKMFRYGNDLLSTTNGGVSWQQEILPFHTPADLTDSVAEVERVFFSPNGKRVYAFRDSAIFFKMTGGAWQGINPASQVQAPYLWKELEFVPDGAGGLDSTHFFIASHLWGRLMEVQYNPTTQTHSFTNIALPFGDTAEAVYLSIPMPDMMYVATGHDLWRYRISSHAWSFIASVPLYGADIWDFEASKSNPAIIYFADLFDIAHMSADTGHTTVPICFYYGNPTHGDVRALHIHSTTNTATGIGDRIYCATDGGISMKPAGVNPLVAQSNTLKNINGKGLATGRFMGVGTSELGGGLIASQGDNGVCSYEANQQPKWYEMASGDAEEAVCSRVEVKALAGSSGGGKTTDMDVVSPSNGRAFGNRHRNFGALDLEPHSQIIPIWADQEGGFYMGQTHMWRVLPGTNNLVQVSGQGAPYDIHLPEYQDSVTHYKSPIKCMSFSHYLDSLTGYV
ncbi:MAG: hypothetical protein JST27_00005, partial [Bacteroidetes bacterium]|nr:hypothetical protein [Bacteroidota bacterium]